jgi:hypothetical protein
MGLRESQRETCEPIVIGKWATDLLWIPLFLETGAPWDSIAAVGFLCSSMVGVIAQDVHRKRKAAGLYDDLTLFRGANKSGNWASP